MYTTAIVAMKIDIYRQPGKHIQHTYRQRGEIADNTLHSVVVNVRIHETHGLETARCKLLPVTVT